VTQLEKDAAARRLEIARKPVGVITYDADRSGNVSRKEYLSYHEIRIRNQFRSLDKDQSKGLKTQEIRELAHASTRQTNAPELAKSGVTVLTFDTDRDGTVTEAEYVRYHLDGISRHFDTLDTSRNGTLEMIETLAIVRKVPPQASQRAPQP